jgi:signal peptidase I
MIQVIMTSTDSVTPRPAIVSVAMYLMLGLGILALFAIPWNPGSVIQGPLYLAAAWGISRNRAWSAYGLALLTGVLTVAALTSQKLPGTQMMLLTVAAALTVAIVLVLFLAGRAIERTYGRRGLAWPWVAGSVLGGLFFVLFGFYQMPTGSMENTLLVGDRIAVWKTHGRLPQRGELVTHYYPVDRRQVFVKRVVGIPGDRIQIRNKQLFVNGAAVPEPYVEHTTPYVDSYRDNFPAEPTFQLFPQAREMLAHNVDRGEVVVPPGRYFVLGDNRDSSLDSRYWGFIEAADVIGVPKVVYYSVKQNVAGTGSKLPIMNVRWQRIFHGLA